MADIFEQMKQGAELLTLMEAIENSGVPFRLEHKGEIYGEWCWETADGHMIARGDSILSVMRTAFGMITRERARD